jgi:hypothetical protein
MTLNGLHQKDDLTPVINAAGTHTPPGVSRSSEFVVQRTAQALRAFFVMDELQSVASAQLSNFCGCEAAAVTHCVSAAITQAVAACMAGTDAKAIAELPDAQGRANAALIPDRHCVNYGHPLLIDVRLAGARAIRAGNHAPCSLNDIEEALAQPGIGEAIVLALPVGEPGTPRLLGSMNRQLEPGLAVHIGAGIHEFFLVNHHVEVAQGDAVDGVGLGDQRLVQRAADALAQAAQGGAAFHGGNHHLRLEHEKERVEAAV